MIRIVLELPDITFFHDEKDGDVKVREGMGAMLVNIGLDPKSAEMLSLPRQSLLASLVMLRAAAITFRHPSGAESQDAEIGGLKFVSLAAQEWIESGEALPMTIPQKEVEA